MITSSNLASRGCGERGKSSNRFGSSAAKRSTSTADFYTRGIETERLILRRPVADDADAPIWFGIDPAQALALADDHWERHGFGPWTAVLRETGEPVASIDLHFAGPGIVGIDADEIEVGWVVAVAARGRGFATEAARAAIGYAFDVLGVDQVVAYTSPGNAASLRVMEKLGMTVRGEGRSRDGKPAVILVDRRGPQPAAAC
jgi:RimJ/RimL family protein N-acetyltransferase